MIRIFLRHRIQKKKKFEQFLQHEKFLKNGNYKFNKIYSCLYLDNEENRSHLNNVIENDPRKRTNFKKKIIKYLVYTGKIKINGSLSSKEFSGTLYFFSNNGNEEKVFDFENKKVKLLYHDSSDYEFKIDSHDYFKKYFNVPSIEVKENEIIDERLIVFNNNLDDTKMLLTSSFNSYLEYFKRLDIKNLDYFNIGKELLSQELTSREKIFFKLIINFKAEIPQVRMHGDFRRHNILVEKETANQYIIDWEFSKHYFFFYDLFHFIYHDTINDESSELLSNYFSGKYDSYLFEIFSIFKIKFDVDQKRQYFYIFLFEHYMKKGKRDCMLLEKYEKLLQRY